MTDKKKYELYHENKVHTPPDFPYNTYLCSIPLDFKSVKIHWHEEIEIIVIKKGSGIVNVNLVPYTVNAGDIVLVFSGQLHSIEQIENSVMEYENIIFKTSLLKSSGQDFCNDNFLNPLFSGEFQICPAIRHEKIQSLIDEIDNLRQEQRFGYQLAVKANLLNIMFELITECVHTESRTVNEKALDKMKAVLTYISENYQSPITIDEISKQCFYSKSYFMKFFKEITGMGFIKYLNEYRLEIAADMLLNSDGNIIDIAENSGFNNLSYFNRSFKKKYGVSPGKYRSYGK